MDDFLKGLNVFILPLGFGPKRLKFLEGEVKKRGGKIAGENEQSPSHVVVEDSVASDGKKVLSAVKNKYGDSDEWKNVRYVRATWLSECFKQKSLVETDELEWLKNDVDDDGRGKRTRRGDVTEEGSPEKRKKFEVEEFLCSLSSSSGQGFPNPNQVLIDELEKLANCYAVRNDKWRSHAYRKAINALTMHKKKIETFQEARSIPGIGEKMASKLMEILECGRLRKADEVADDKTRILESFCKVWGAGPSTAESWYALGCRRLEDVREKAKLSNQQKIGLKYYEDLLERIPRKEVEDIFDLIRHEALKITDSLRLELVGSYRRGKPSCGDVDVMIINSGCKSPGDLLIQLTNSLKAQGCLTDDLVNLGSPEPENNHRKYFGIIKTAEDKSLHRRLDLFVVPECEEAAARFHYTGSALYNRRVKMLAVGKGMSLTEHGLYAGTIRKGGEIVSKGRIIPTEKEEDIFRELGLPYKPPEERDY